MTDSAAHSAIAAFFRALGESDFKAVAALLDDNIRWTIGGPVDILPVCGLRVGKPAVIDLLERQITTMFGERRFERDMVLIDGNRGASLCRILARTAQAQTIAFRGAQFVIFRDGKAVEYHSILDSFDAVEQVTGQRIIPENTAMPISDLVAV